MIQLDILREDRPIRECEVSRFPFEIGRANDAHLVLEGEGVWDRHASLRLAPAEGFLLIAHPGALVSVNGHPQTQARLRNGDLIACGSVNLRFWLGRVRQRGLRPREVLSWLALAGLFALQLSLIYWLQA